MISRIVPKLMSCSLILCLAPSEPVRNETTWRTELKGIERRGRGLCAIAPRFHWAACGQCQDLSQSAQAELLATKKWRGTALPWKTRLAGYASAFMLLLAESGPRGPDARVFRLFTSPLPFRAGCRYLRSPPSPQHSKT